MATQELREIMEEAHPKGSRLELVKMDDTQAPPVGTQGTVNYVDGMAQLHVQWDNGSTLALIYGEDEWVLK